MMDVFRPIRGKRPVWTPEIKGDSNTHLCNRMKYS